MTTLRSVSYFPITWMGGGDLFLTELLVFSNYDSLIDSNLRLMPDFCVAIERWKAETQAERLISLFLINSISLISKEGVR